jgi:DNA repair exonuclease SbcCD nuclease subunit
MTNIAILNDTHAGIKRGSDVFLDYSERFYENVFFPHLLEHNIKHILHLGDYFDHRKYVNFKVLSRNYDMFISKLIEHDIHMDIILGNHDIYHNNTLELNSLKEILDQYENITIYDKPCDVTYGNLSIALLPWLCAENKESSMNFVKNSKSNVLAGHLELDGFDLLKGIKSVHGMSSKEFERFDLVLSGHYHTKSSKHNINYLGTQLQFTWADVDDPKGFHTLDTDTRELNFVENPEILYHKLKYDEDHVPEILPSYAGTYIKIIVLNKKDLYKFDQWYEKLLKVEPFDVTIIDNFEEYLGSNVDDDTVSTIDTESLLNTYIDNTETDLNRDWLKKFVREIYVEAVTTRDI